MALTRVVNYLAKFSGGLIVPTGASATKVAKSNSEGKLEWGEVEESNIKSEAISNAKIKGSTITEGKYGSESVSAPKIKAGAITESKLEGGAVSLTKLAAAVSKQIPAEHGRSAEMVAGKITISAPATTATGAIIVSPEGATMTVALAVTERTAGTGFKVEGAATSTDRINWAVWTE